MTAALAATPSSLAPSASTVVTATGLTDGKHRLLLNGVVTGPTICSSGTGYTKSVTVGSAVGTYTISDEQYSAGVWTEVANTTVTVVSSGTVTTVVRGGKGQVITANNTVIDGITFRGPGNNIFGSSYGVYGVGAYTGVIIRNCIFNNFDFAAIWLDGLIDPLIENCTINDVTYVGIMLLGCTKGAGAGPTIQNNIVARIGKAPGAHQTPDFNAYGIAVSMHSGGTASADWTVLSNTVTDVPLWHGIDTHGGLRGTIAHNTVRYCARPFFITSNQTTERATSVVVDRNLATDPDTQTGGTDSNTAITTYDTRTSSVLNNVVSVAYPNIHNDSGSLSTGLTLTPLGVGGTRGTTIPAYP